MLYTPATEELNAMWFEMYKFHRTVTYDYSISESSCISYDNGWSICMDYGAWTEPLYPQSMEDIHQLIRLFTNPQ